MSTDQFPAPAIVLAGGYYLTPNGKTAHGLVRGSERFAVSAVVDPDAAGQDAGEALDGRHRAIPIVATLAQALRAAPDARWAIIGAATHGGMLEAPLREAVLAAINAGLNAANGLHAQLAQDAEIAAAAKARGVDLVDLRRPKPWHLLHAWHGSVAAVTTPRIAVLGTDCALGKRTTARLLVEALRDAGRKAEMIYTGQTGWLQGGRYGFVLDSTPNDFVSGELEHAVVTCAAEADPDVMVIEGQSSLRNPSGPCGAELLLSAGATGVVLQHAPGRTHFEGFETLDLPLPALADEIALIGHYGARVLGITANGEGMDRPRLREWCERQRQSLQLPVIDILGEGCGPLLPGLERWMEGAA